MKPINDQHKLYLLSAALLALSVVLCLIWKVWQPPAAAPGNDLRPSLTAPAVPDASSPQPTDTPTAAEAKLANGIETTVYYQDNYGYLVPVVRTIEEQEGIAKATLSLMVSSPRNDMEAARLGLRTVIPEGTELDLDIAQGNARINLVGDVSALTDAQAEANMVNAIVQTLTEFDSVKTVTFLINGQQVKKLPRGSSVSGVFSRGLVNLESSVELAPEDAQTVMLYFPGETASMIVPVTRMVYGQADLNTAVLELVKGPSAQSPLDSALPSGCGLIDVSLKDGVATINFTSEFIKIAEESDGGRVALRAIALTCAQFPGVERVEIQVEGQPYDTGVATNAVPTFVNSAEEIAENHFLAQTAQIFELE